MQREDYLIREIQKIGQMISGLISRLTGNKESYSFTSSDHYHAEEEILLKETGLDLPAFLALDKKDLESCLEGCRGLRSENTELLADLISIMGKKAPDSQKVNYLKRAFDLYELCTKNDKSFSLEREEKIREITLILKNLPDS